MSLAQNASLAQNDEPCSEREPSSEREPRSVGAWPRTMSHAQAEPRPGVTRPASTDLHAQAKPRSGVTRPELPTVGQTPTNSQTRLRLLRRPHAFLLP